MLTRRQTLATLAAAPLAVPALTRSAPPVDVAVIGAGVFGAWTAWHLKKAGLNVVLFDQYGAGNARSSSGGESRVIRYSYGGDPLYSQMALDALDQWDALSQRQSQPILHRTGVLWFADAKEKYTADSLAWADARKLDAPRGDAAWLRKRFPMIRFNDNETGFLEPQSGALIASRGVQAVVADAGLTVAQARIDPPLREPGGLYRIDEGHAARHLIYACGPWLAKLFPEAVGPRITPTRQEVYHFGAGPGSHRFASPLLPVWADFNGGDIAYGFPDLEGQGFKMAFDGHGAVVDPDTQDRRVSAEGVVRARAYLAKRFPDLADAPLIHSRVCQYENSSNGDFLIDRLPGHERVWLVGGGSGHGFKHGPEVGKRVAAHILDPQKAIEPRFSLATKALSANRAVY